VTTLVPKTSVVPPGGFFFIDKSSGVDVRIEGTDEADVEQRLLKFRLDNGLPPGNPLAEYREWLCSTWPHFCTGAGPELAPTQAAGEHISKRVATWMANFIRNYRSSDLVSPGEADRRAAICSRCPANVSYNLSGCGACHESVARLAFVYKANRQTQYDSELRACNFTSQHNGTAVWAATLPPADSAPLPDFCWRKNI
jgi:hypothetical protein